MRTWIIILIMAAPMIYFFWAAPLWAIILFYLLSDNKK
jgi:hypothetical protein